MADREERRERERSRDLERLLTFVDAIAAVAITLLVLPLADLAASADKHRSVAHLISVHGDQFWAFLLSFVVIARLWLAQHLLMSPVIGANAMLTRLLVLWTIAIVFLPFPTALVAEVGEQRTTKLLYIGTLTVSALALTAIAVVVQRNPELHEPDRAPRIEPAAAVAVSLVLALAVALIFPSTGYYPLLLMLGSNVLDWVRRARRRA